MKTSQGMKSWEIICRGQVTATTLVGNDQTSITDNKREEDSESQPWGKTIKVGKEGYNT